MFKSFEYLKPTTIEEAVEMGKKYGSEAKYFAGGTDVLVNLKNYPEEAVKFLISLRYVNEQMNYISLENGELKIGALTSHRDLEQSDLIRGKYQVLYDAVSQIGSVQIRNVATIGGNICSSLPSADTASPLLVLNAKLKIIGQEGEKVVALEDIFLGYAQNMLKAGDIVTEIIIPEKQSYADGAYYKLGRRKAMELPIVGAAVYLVMDNDLDICLDAKVALTTAAPVPMLAKKAGEELKGKQIDSDSLAQAGNIAVQESSPRSSSRSTVEYRKEVIPVIVRRAGLEAYERIKRSSS